MTPTNVDGAERMTILAWHNDPALKASAVERMRQHRAEDTLVQGAYALDDPEAASGYRGCFHGCLTVEAIAARDKRPLTSLIKPGPNWHRETELIFGIPEPVGDLLDQIFEMIDPADAAAFAVDATEAIPVGADLSLILPRLILDLLADDPDKAVVPSIPADSPLRPVADATVALYRRHLAGDPPADIEWSEVHEQYFDVPFAGRRDTSDGIPGIVLNDALESGLDGFDEPFALIEPSDDRRAPWLAARTLHHLAAAPIPAPDPT